MLVKLNDGLDDHRVEIVCPKCGHKHTRIIHKGVVSEQGRFDSKTTEEIHVPLAAWSKEPRTKEMKEHCGKNFQKEREGVVITEPLAIQPEHPEVVARGFLRDLWSRVKS